MGALSSAAGGLAGIGSLAGGILPIVQGISQIGNAFSKLSAGPQQQQQAQRDSLAAQQSLMLAQLRQKQDAQMQDLQTQTALQKTQLATQARIAEESRRTALRRAVARQNAIFGARGLSPADGSSEAVLLGLMSASGQEAQDNARLDNLRSVALDQNLFSQQQMNILSRQQLTEQNALQRTIQGF